MTTEYDDYEDADLGPARPWWVEVGLWGLPNRASAWAFFWLSVLLAVGSLVGAVFFWALGFGVLFLLAAWWYYACIRWVDRHDRWG